MESLNFYTDACKIFRETVTSKVGDAIIPGERFLLFDGWSEIKDTRLGRTHLVIARERVTIFCSDVGLRLLSQADKIGADGTFKTRPILYEHVYM